MPITTATKSSYLKVAVPFLMVSRCWKAAALGGRRICAWTIIVQIFTLHVEQENKIHGGTRQPSLLAFFYREWTQVVWHSTQLIAEYNSARLWMRDLLSPYAVYMYMYIRYAESKQWHAQGYTHMYMYIFYSLVSTLSLTQQATKLSNPILPPVEKCLTMAPCAWG